jgi:hypothetical protein
VLESMRKGVRFTDLATGRTMIDCFTSPGASTPEGVTRWCSPRLRMRSVLSTWELDAHVSVEGRAGPRAGGNRPEGARSRSLRFRRGRRSGLFDQTGSRGKREAYGRLYHQGLSRPYGVRPFSQRQGALSPSFRAAHAGVRIRSLQRSRRDRAAHKRFDRGRHRRARSGRGRDISRLRRIPQGDQEALRQARCDIDIR